MKKENIHFIQDHEKIIDYIDEKSIITNIDHHPDIFYSKDDVEQKINKEKINCGNWIKYLFDNDKIIRYHWVNNSNSTDLLPNNLEILTTQTDFKNYNLDILTVPDKLIICFSPIWIPPIYRELFYTWMDICNFIHNTHFDIEG